MKKFLLITAILSQIVSAMTLQTMTLEEYNLYQNALYYYNNNPMSAFFYLNGIGTSAAERVAKFIKENAKKAARYDREIRRANK